MKSPDRYSLVVVIYFLLKCDKIHILVRSAVLIKFLNERLKQFFWMAWPFFHEIQKTKKT